MTDAASIGIITYMASFLFWFLLAILCFLAAAMLASYALWYYENQKVIDLANQMKANNQTSILNKGLGKRGFTTFDLNASINRSKSMAKGIVSATVHGVTGFAKTVSKGGFLGNVKKEAKKTMNGITNGLGSIIKPAQDNQSQEVELSPQERKEQMYHRDVDKILEQQVPQTTTHQATLDLAKGSEKKAEPNMTMFEKMELRILNNLKESGMTNYDIWLELGALYKKFGQNEKAKEVFALVLKHAGDTNKERARNELIGLS